MSEQSSQSSDLSPESRMHQLIFGFMALPAIAVAAKLGIADLITESAKTVDELANATNAHVLSLRRLLRFLTNLGIFAEDTAGKYRQTPLSEFLRNGAPQSFRGLAIMLGSKYMWRPWGELCEAFLTGKSGFDHVYGASILEYLSAHPEKLAIRNAAMTSLSSVELPQILAAYNFSQFERIADLGGGQGALLHGILSAYPKLRGILVDLPAVVAGSALQTGTTADRCEVIGVDLFEMVPEGADAYLMKYVIHLFSDADALRILRNCRYTIRHEGKLLLIERVLKAPNEPDPGKFMDLQMLVVTEGGRERAEADYRALLYEAGFSLTQVVPTAGPLSIIESRPV
jgi:O-methyltransferase domain/Dimerisation domain